MVVEDRYSFGPFTLDIQNRRILRDGRPVKWWSRRRYEILKMLIEAGGDVVPYDALIREVWGGRDVILHTITQTANDLKRCLGEYGDCVQNQHGEGYYFQAPPAAPRHIVADLDLDALTLYGLALEELNRRTESSLQRALEYFRVVVGRYPDFVPALLGVADCLTLLGHAGFPVFKPDEVISEARAAVNKALALASDAETSAAALTALGKIQLMFDWDWQAAEEQFNKARILNPRNMQAYHGLGHLFLITHRWKESLAAIAHARRLAPSSPMLHGTAGWFKYFMGNNKEAIAHCQTTTLLHPLFPAGYVMLGLPYEAEGLYRESITAFQTSLDLQPSPVPLSALGHAFCSAGKRQSATRILKQLRSMAERLTAISPYHYALIHAGLGEVDDCLSCLEHAYRERFDWLIQLSVDPRWRLLYKERRFRTLLKHLDLYESWEASA